MASPGANGALRPEAWERYLTEDDKDRDFIWNGVNDGFQITNKDTRMASAHYGNHRSALDPGKRREVQ